MIKRSVGSLCFILILGLLLATSVAALDDQDLENIQRAIEETGARWTAADNPIFRLSPEEQRRLCGLNPESSQGIEERLWVPKGPKPDLPEKLDWRDMEGANWVTPIRDQGPCGSCVAFGTMGAFEARINIAANSPGQDLDLSEQHIFSCGGGSCGYGWWYGDAAQYLKDQGAPLEECLPYRAVDNNCSETCSDWRQQARKVSDWSTIRYGAEVVEQMKTALMEGPLVGGFTVMDDFFAYSGGVYRYTSGTVAGGHCICIVGWDDADSCWIVKNSWGSRWGEDGYFRIRMGTCEVGIEEQSFVLIPETAYAANLVMAGYEIFDDAIEGNGLPDAGETFDFTVTVKNYRTWGDLTDVTGWLLPTDPRITLDNVQGTYPDLPGGATSTNTDDPFKVTVSDQLGITAIPFNLYVTGTCANTYPYSQELTFQLPITVSQEGWPVATSSGVRCSPLMVWMGGGPRRLVVTEDGGYLHVFEGDGQEVDGFPFRAPGGNIWGSVAMGDLDGDGFEEFIFGSKNDTLYAIRQDGTVLFKRNMGADVLATPIVGDLDGDGSPEIVLGTADSQLHVLTAQGQKYSPFPIILGGSVMTDAAVADLNRDGVIDVAVGASNGQVYAVSIKTGELLPGFPFATGGTIWCSPVIADMDADGYPEIIIGSDAKRLFAIDRTGEALFTYNAFQPIKSSPAIADLNADDRLDVIFTCSDGRVHAVDNMGHSISGWPYDTGSLVLSSPIVLDIDGDGALEVVLEAPGPELIHLKANGSLLMSLPIAATGLAMSTPIAGDLDCDGDLEVAVGTPSGVSVWNYPTASTVDMPWPMYRGNARRTGFTGDVTTARPEDDPSPQTVPVEYALRQNYPNPFNPETTIRYSLANDGIIRLSIYNVLGQEVVTLVSAHQAAGSHEAVWDGRDVVGSQVSSGLYFYRLQAGDFVETRKMILLR